MLYHIENKANKVYMLHSSASCSALCTRWVGWELASSAATPHVAVDTWWLPYGLPVRLPW